MSVCGCVDWKTDLNTSGYGECGKVIFGNSESGGIVCGDTQVVPGGRFQVEHYVVVVGLNVVRDLIPFQLIAERTSQISIVNEISSCMPEDQIPFLALNNKVGHGATSIFPGLEVQRH